MPQEQTKNTKATLRLNTKTAQASDAEQSPQQVDKESPALTKPLQSQTTNCCFDPGIGCFLWMLSHRLSALQP